MIPLESFVQRVGSEASRGASDGGANEQIELLFSCDGSGMDAVEMLTLRLTALHQAARALREHYRLFDRAHLDVSSESLTVALGDPAPGLPSLWSYRVRLDPTSALDVLELGPGVVVTIPPDDPVAPFFSPSIRDFLLTGHRTGELKVDRLTSEPNGMWRIEGELIDPRGVFPKPGPEDWAKLTWAEDPGDLGVLEAVARIDPREANGNGGGRMALTTEPLSMAEKAADRVQRAGGVIVPNVTYRVFPSFGPSDDLFSLGMVLFLCVLVNDTHDLGLVTDDLGILGLEQRRDGDWLEAAHEQVARNPDGWGPNAVFFDAVDRSGDRPNLIPDDLWFEILAFGFRMVSAAPDLVKENESGAVLFARVEAELAGMVRLLRRLLFDRQALNLEIQTVIAELLSEE
jgi:hypothetical protein